MLKKNTVIFFGIFLLIQSVICRNINENIDNKNSSVISSSDNENDSASSSLIKNVEEEAKTFEIISDNDENIEDKSDNTELTDDISEGRTYAHHFAKRMAVLLLPLMFKLGVVMTMLAFLTVISVKSLIVGVGLMVVGLSHVLARAYSASVQPPIIPSAPLLVNPYAGLLRAPIPHVGLAGWEKRSSNVPAPRSHDPHRDAYGKQYTAAPTVSPQVANVVDLQSASTNHGTTGYYVLNSGPEAGVIQTYH